MGITAALQAVERMKDILLYTKQELALRDRIVRMQAVLAQEDITSADILRAEFGTSQINGLDIKAMPAHPVRIMPLEQADYIQEKTEAERKRYLQYVVGSAGAGQDINLQQAYIDALGVPYRIDRQTLGFMARVASVVGHENTHRLQAVAKDAGWLKGAGYTTSFLIDRPLVGGGLVNGALNVATDAYRAMADYLAYRRTGHKVSDYYAKPYEIQARMHEIMAAGYAQWERLPASKTELQAALYNAGVKTPMSVMWSLTTSAEGQRALAAFDCSPVVLKAMAETVKDLNRVVDYAALPGRRALLWNDIFPQEYGHLIEMYGDGPGRARMGLGPNPAPVMAASAAVVDDAPLSAERAATLAAAVPPEWASRFFNILAQAESFTDNQRVMAAALMARDETRQAIIAVDEVQSERLMDWEPLHKAMREGNSEAVEMLLATGCDPLRTVMCTSIVRDDIRSIKLTDMPAIIRLYESRIIREDLGLSRTFNEKSEREVLREALVKIDKGLAGVARHYGEGWLETAPAALHEVIALTRDRMAAAAKTVPVPAMASLQGPDGLNH